MLGIPSAISALRAFLLGLGLGGVVLVVAGPWAYSLGVEHEHARRVAEVQSIRAVTEARARAAENHLRHAESRLQQATREADDALAAEREKAASYAADAAAHAAERDRLRAQLRGFAGGASDGRATAADTPASANLRAAQLGELVAEALRVGEECAIDGERVSADLRALRAWAAAVMSAAAEVAAEGDR